MSRATPFQTWKLLIGRVDRSIIAKTSSVTSQEGWRKIVDQGASLTVYVMLAVVVIAAIVTVNLPFYLGHQTQKHIAALPTMSIRDVPFTPVKGVIEKVLERPTLMDDASLQKIPQNIQSPWILEEMEKIVSSHPQINIAQHPIAVVAPADIKENTTGVLRALGVEVVNSDCQSCLVIFRASAQDRYWRVSTRNISVDRDYINALSAHVFIEVHKHASQLKSTPFAIAPVVIKKSEILPSIQSVAQYLFSSMINVIAILIWWAAVTGPGLLGYSWDIKRMRGHLEFLVLARQPIWVLYGASIYQNVKWIMVVLTIMLVLALCWQIPLHWGLMLALWIAAPFMIVFMSMWSLLATVMFHHAQGRMFARLLLSPLPFCLLWCIRLSVLWAAYKVAQPLQAWDWFHQVPQHWPMVLALPVVVTLAIIVLFHLINWRIGPRREGLRRVV